MSTSAVSTSSLNQQLQQYFQTRQSDLQQLGQALGSGNLAGAQTAYNNIVSLGQGGPFSSGNPFKANQREQDFTAVGQALQSGDLAGAQQAFSSLAGTFGNRVQQQIDPLPPNLNSTAPSSSAGPEIIVNLSTGSSSGAQQANPSPVSSSASSGPEIIVNLSSAGSGGSSGIEPQVDASPAGSGPEIVLNLGGGTSATPEQVTINISNPSNGGREQVSLSVGNQGSNAQQITFNLNSNTNEEIILNLLGASTATSTGGSSSGSSSTGSLNVSA